MKRGMRWGVPTRGPVGAPQVEPCHWGTERTRAVLNRAVHGVCTEQQIADAEAAVKANQESVNMCRAPSRVTLALPPDAGEAGAAGQVSRRGPRPFQPPFNFPPATDSPNFFPPAAHLNPCRPARHPRRATSLPQRWPSAPRWSRWCGSAPSARSAARTARAGCPGRYRTRRLERQQRCCPCPRSTPFIHFASVALAW